MALARHATAPCALVLAVALVAAGCGSSKTCPKGQADCFGTCRDLSSDPFACGQCGIQCGAGGQCVSGACGCPPASPDACPGGCTDVSRDNQNCGACGHGCGLGTCTGGGAGSCVCAAGASDCGTAVARQCVDVQTDYANCGGCGATCTRVGGICSQGTCACPAARPSYCAVGDLCTDLQTDESNCGACGTACTVVNEQCTAGQCRCPATLPQVCGGACVNTSTDPSNCGGCGSVCPTGQCTAGRCCPASQVQCGALCCDGGCCPGGTCMVRHDAGTGAPSAVFFDCNPAGSKAAAQAAALAWRPSGAPVTGYDGLGCSFATECVAWNAGTVPNQCAVWCYAGFLAGKVRVESISGVCLCPDSASGSWR